MDWCLGPEPPDTLQENLRRLARMNDIASRPPQWEQCLTAIQALGSKATCDQIWNYLKQFRSDVGRSTVYDTLQNLSVNSNSRCSHPAGKDPRLTNCGHRHDRLFKEGAGANAVYVPYDATLHGVWEVYKDYAATSTHGTSVRQVDAVPFNARSAMAYLDARYPGTHSGTTHIATYRTASGRQLALDPGKVPEAKLVVSVFVDAMPPYAPADDVTEYLPEESRNHHLRQHAPALAAGQRAFLVRVESLPALAELCNWYESDPSASPSAPHPSSTIPAMTIQQPLNQILYGPPGTGKTYRTIDKALAILDPGFSGSRHAMKQRFDELASEERIKFVTFHQSFSYENFVEGISAKVDETTKQPKYEVEDGIFKEICTAARSRVIQSVSTGIDITGKRIWKLSLGEAGSEENVYDDCIEQGLALIGFGNDADFSDAKNRNAIAQKFRDAGEDVSTGDYPVGAVSTFVLEMKVGDLIVVSQGNLKFRAIGEITSEYFHHDRGGEDTYSQARRVKWLRVYDAGVPHLELMKKNFSQRTVYQLHPDSISLEKLTKILSNQDETPEANSRVLIIDEINRGNISRIFGELITLIEPSKRAGSSETLEVTLPYSKEKFTVPDNVYLIGTMNTSDRSLAGLDIALRRRFVFEELPPQPELLKGRIVSGVDLERMLRAINARIEVLLGRDYQIGHAYFLHVTSMADLEGVFLRQILPLLQEYFFEDWEKIGLVLNDPNKTAAQQFLMQPDTDLQRLFGRVQVRATNPRWELQPLAFKDASSYVGIYETV